MGILASFDWSLGTIPNKQKFPNRTLNNPMLERRWNKNWSLKYANNLTIHMIVVTYFLHLAFTRIVIFVRGKVLITVNIFWTLKFCISHSCKLLVNSQKPVLLVIFCPHFTDGATEVQRISNLSMVKYLVSDRARIWAWDTQGNPL